MFTNRLIRNFTIAILLSLFSTPCTGKRRPDWKNPSQTFIRTDLGQFFGSQTRFMQESSLHNFKIGSASTLSSN